MKIVPNIKRVVSVFILKSDPQNKIPQLAVFHRCETMPSFNSHWATCSGSIEPNESPLQSAQRELSEETNLFESANVKVTSPGGLHVDVDLSEEKKIRVYPFTAHIPSDTTLELRGTEHDAFKWIPISEIAKLDPAVPKLYEAFHHATHGQYLNIHQQDNLELHPEIEEWATDRINGAAFLARQAVDLAQKYPKSARWIGAMRPTMVPIVNAMQHFVEKYESGEPCSPTAIGDEIFCGMQKEFERSVQLGVNTLLQLASQHDYNPNAIGRSPPFTIATISRSFTLKTIITQFLQQRPNSIPVKVLCAKSVPGEEGVLMATDIATSGIYPGVVSCSCVEDEDLFNQISISNSDFNTINAIVVGSDCIIPNKFVVNKVGTNKLEECAREGQVPIFCCADRWKVWDEEFPPPLEEIFELVPYESFTEVLIPDKE